MFHLYALYYGRGRCIGLPSDPNIYLLKLLCDQGLIKVDVIFQAIIISCIRYAISARGFFLFSVSINRIDAFLKRTHKYGLTSIVYTFQELLDKSDMVLFRSMQDKANSINHLLPNSKTNGYL